MAPHAGRQHIALNHRVGHVNSDSEAKDRQTAWEPTRHYRQLSGMPTCVHTMPPGFNALCMASKKGCIPHTSVRTIYTWHRLMAHKGADEPCGVAVEGEGPTF